MSWGARMATGVRPLFARRNHADAAGVMQGPVTRANRGIFPGAAGAGAAAGRDAAKGKKGRSRTVDPDPILRGKTIVRVFTPP
jgi:hypothetical protein